MLNCRCNTGICAGYAVLEHLEALLLVIGRIEYSQVVGSLHADLEASVDGVGGYVKSESM